MATESSKIKKLAGQRTDIVGSIINQIEKLVGSGQNWLIKALIDDLIDRLDKDGDKIKNTQANKRLLNMVDSLFNQYQKEAGLVVVKAVMDGINKIVDFNSRYFSTFGDRVKMGKIQEQVKTDLSSWLGIDKKGRLIVNGYLNKIVTDTSVRNTVKDMAIKAVVGQAGYSETKSSFREFIAGPDSGDTGALKKYYRNFVFDMFSQVDRVNSKLFADKLKLRFAIYEGGIIKTSRKFCIDHNGKVYHESEIAEFDITEARPPGYNPFTDLGGYGCRHHLNWIPDSVAYALRPETRTLFPANAA